MTPYGAGRLRENDTDVQSNVSNPQARRQVRGAVTPCEFQQKIRCVREPLLRRWCGSRPLVLGLNVAHFVTLTHLAMTAYSGQSHVVTVQLKAKIARKVIAQRIEV